MNNIINKPEVLKRDWLRAKEVVEIFGCGLSTIYFWRETKVLKKWKKVSPRITVYSRQELFELFNPAPEIAKKKRRKKKKTFSTAKTKVIKRQKTSYTNSLRATTIIKQSKEVDDKMIAMYISKEEKLKVKQTHPAVKRKKHAKPSSAKEGFMGTNKKILKKLNAKRKTNV